MANEIRKYKVSLLDVLNLTNMCRGSRLLAGSLPRQEVLKKLRKIQDGLSKEDTASVDPRKVLKDLALNREELGALKLTFIELWSSDQATGELREAIETVATKLDIWREHVYKNLPKEPSVAIDTFDSDTDILSGDSGEGKIEEVVPVAPVPAALPEVELAPEG